MILSNVAIIEAIRNGSISIEPITRQNGEIIPIEDLDPAIPPFNTTSIDLRLASTISEPQGNTEVTLRPYIGGGSLAKNLKANSQQQEINDKVAYKLKPHSFILAQTKEKVDFPIPEDESSICYSARVEGKSSLARCGLLVHFTAPTIHAGFNGPITLEIINLGPNEIWLEKDTYICQLIIEEVKGVPILTPSQFRGQTTPIGDQ
jgi:dCTP deaminase